MAISFPTGLDNFTNPSSGNTLDSPSHSLQHSDLNDAVEALETKLGVGSSPAGSATAGQVLTISAAGTSTWVGQGLTQIIPTSVTVGSGSGSVDANGAVTFSGASSISLNGCFSSSFDNYRILWNVDSGSSTGAANVYYRLGTSGTANTASSYYSVGVYSDGTVGNVNQSATNYGWLYGGPGAETGQRSGFMDIQNPFKTIRTIGQIFSGSGDFARYWSLSTIFANTTSFTDFLVIPSANNITGTIRVYGFRN